MKKIIAWIKNLWPLCPHFVLKEDRFGGPLFPCMRCEKKKLGGEV